MNIMNQIFAGMRLQLRAFGGATVRKLFVPTGSKELCVDVKADNGETLHLSMKYVERLMS